MTIIFADLVEQRGNELLLKRYEGNKMKYFYVPNGEIINEYYYKVCNSTYGKDTYITDTSLEKLKNKYWNKHQKLYDMELW